MTEKKFSNMMKMIFTTQEDDITCGECYRHIDQYVDMLRAGKEPEKVLPEVKHHLDQCRCCETEFQALISILEAETE